MFKALRSRLSLGSPTRWLTGLLLLVAAGTTHCAQFNWNDESRMATIQSVVESKTFAIDNSGIAGTGDKVLIAGRFYPFFFLNPAARRLQGRARTMFIALLCMSNAIAFVGALHPRSALAYSNVPCVDNILGFIEDLPPGTIL